MGESVGGGDAMGSRGKDGFYTVADVDTGRGQLQGEEDEEDDMIEQALEKSRQRKEKELAGDDGDVGTGDGARGGMSGWFTRLTAAGVDVGDGVEAVLSAGAHRVLGDEVIDPSLAERSGDPGGRVGRWRG